MKTKLKNQKGFTIIEVLIVLAIAGLILLIVFLAVPALQRNSRNTQRRNDVSAILGAVQEYANNNNGTLPTGWNTGTSALTGTGTDLTVKLGYYLPTDVSVDNTAGNLSNANDEAKLLVAVNHSCFGPTISTDASRKVALLFTVEKATQQCQDS